MLKDIVARNAVRTREMNRPEPTEPLSQFNRLPQDVAAEHARLQPRRLGKIERGEQNATLKTIWRLEWGYDLRRYELFNENSGREDASCYATLNRFARRCIRHPDDTPDTEPSPLLDMIDDLLLENVTVDAIERMAEGCEVHKKHG